MNNKIIKYIKKPKLIILYLASKGLLNFIPDQQYLKLIYWVRFNKKLNLSNPLTFNEKLQWLKLNNRKKEYSDMVDKVEAKKYVTSIIGKQYIIPTLQVCNQFKEIDFENLPEQFVIKVTHTSGDVFICKNKSKLDTNELEKKINKWLKKNYYLEHREWPYKNVKPRIIIEQFMEDDEVKDLRDYKIFCFNGKPEIILVCSNRHGKDKNTDFYNTKWERVSMTRENHDNSSGISKPTNLAEMLEIAKKLSKEIPFVRVDLYEINRKIYFGELTFFPSAGFEGFRPNDIDLKLGEKININF